MPQTNSDSKHTLNWPEATVFIVGAFAVVAITYILSK